MKSRSLPIRQMLVAAALLLVAGLFVACSGDDDDGVGEGPDEVRQLEPGEIRTDKGLGVAAQANALGANFGGDTESDDGAAIRAEASVSGGAAPAADAASRGVGIDIAYPYYNPQAIGGGEGLTVQGYGSATATADSAVIEIYFYRDSYSIDKPLPVEPDGGSGSSGSSDGSEDFAEPSPVDAITEGELQPVIDALRAAGADNVEFVDQQYYDRYYASATLRAEFGGTDGVESALDAANAAAEGLDGIFFSGSNMYFTVADCSSLERAAMEAALEDAGERGDVLASVIGSGRGEIVGASNYTYSPYGDGSCTTSYYGYPMPLAEDGSQAPGAMDVQVFSSLTVTYAIN